VGVTGVPSRLVPRKLETFVGHNLKYSLSFLNPS
jgi:hypothetical protein